MKLESGQYYMTTHEHYIVIIQPYKFLEDTCSYRAWSALGDSYRKYDNFADIDQSQLLAHLVKYNLIPMDKEKAEMLVNLWESK